jgi:hypothetical protein
MKKFLNTALKMAKFQFVLQLYRSILICRIKVGYLGLPQLRRNVYFAACCHLWQQHIGAHSVKPTTADKTNP